MQHEPVRQLADLIEQVVQQLYASCQLSAVSKGTLSAAKAIHGPQHLVIERVGVDRRGPEAQHRRWILGLIGLGIANELRQG